MEKLKFKKWLLLGEYQDRVVDAVKSKDYLAIAHSIIEYVKFATEKQDVMELPWYEIAILHQEIVVANDTKLDLPLLRSTATKKEENAWDYPRRSWFSWADLFASSYGWSLEYIANLDVEDALPLCQELLVREQHEKEWEWGMTELAYKYDPTTKTSSLQPLPRPDWMRPKKSDRIVKIPKSMLPAGVIVAGEERPPDEPT